MTTHLYIGMAQVATTSCRSDMHRWLPLVSTGTGDCRRFSSTCNNSCLTKDKQLNLHSTSMQPARTKRITSDYHNFLFSRVFFIHSSFKNVSLVKMWAVGKRLGNSFISCYDNCPTHFHNF